MRKRHIALLATSALVGIAAGTVWLFRSEIVTHFADREFARRGVHARYTIEQIGLGRHRLRNVVIGDPAHPDLVARTLEIGVGIGMSGPQLTMVRARGVRLRGRWDGHKLHFGDVDKLIPAPDGKPFTIPNLHLDIADSAGRLETPWGVVGLGVHGRGPLRGGFAGKLALVATQLAQGGCRVAGVRAALDIRVDNATPALDGPASIVHAECPAKGATLEQALIGVHASIPEALSDWQVVLGLRSGGARAAGSQAAALTGELRAGGAGSGLVDASYRIAAHHLVSPWGQASNVGIEGSVRVTRGGDLLANGRASVVRVDVSARTGAMVDRLARMDDSTPLGPVARQLATAIGRAGRNIEGSGAFALAQPHNGPLVVRIGDVALASESGARLAVAGADALRWTAGQGVSLAAQGQVGGGGLPQGSFSFSKTAPTAPITGTVQFAPYAAGSAAIALAPLRLVVAPDGASRFLGGIALTGPLGPDGRVDRLAMPLDGTVSADGRVSIGERCRALSWQSIRYAATRLDRGSVSLCPLGGDPLVRWGSGGADVAARLAPFTLRGRSGTSALTLSSAGGDMRLGEQRFAFRQVAVQLGEGDDSTAFSAASLDGALRHGLVGGQIAGVAGKIGPTPFVFADGNGRWRFDHGALLLDAAVGATDSAAPVRFQPMRLPDLHVRYADGAITAQSSVHEAGTNALVANLDVRHRLEDSDGEARFVVPGIRFARESLQPVMLTRLALGVVANVEGTVTGDGRIGWTRDGVTSSGDFSTRDMNLAAAFGPVAGLAGTIHFDDLLGLTTPPGQRVTIASINPGIEVRDGVATYQLEPGQRVRIEGGEWPFAGGVLRLQPALLNFAVDRPRYLTFDVSGVDAALFLQRYEFDNVSASGVFDGVLPTVFDASGGRVENGILVTRDGGGTLAYVGELSNRNLGYFGNLAFGALKSLKYDNLVIHLDGRIDGDMVTEVDFTGLAQGEGAESNFLTRAIKRLPFTFRISIHAPFRQLLSSARGYFDPAVLIEQNLQALIAAQQAADAAAHRPHGESPAPPAAPPASAAPPAAPVAPDHVTPDHAAQPPAPIQPSESESQP